MLIVSDTTPIITLMKMGHLDILKQLYGKVLIPEAVYQELTENPSYEREALIIRNAEFLWEVPVENVKSVSLLRSQRIPLPLFFYKGRGFS